MAELKAGRKAPTFDLEATGGKKIALKEFAGRKVALFFYPKDSTSG